MGDQISPGGLLSSEELNLDSQVFVAYLNP